MPTLHDLPRMKPRHRALGISGLPIGICDVIRYYPLRRRSSRGYVQVGDHLVRPFAGDYGTCSCKDWFWRCRGHDRWCKHLSAVHVLLFGVEG